MSKASRLGRCHSIAHLRDETKRILPRMVFDFVDGAAQTESTARANRDALDRRRLLSAGAIDVKERSTAVALFGKPSAMPAVIGPTGLAAALWPRGDILLARAASRFGIPFVISMGTNAPLAKIAESADGRIWLQLYITPSRDHMLRLLQVAQDLAFEAIEITVDTAVPGRRERDLVNGFGIPFNWTPAKVLDVLRHPGWMFRILPHGTPMPAMMEIDNGGTRWANPSEFVRAQINPSVGWNDLKWFRDQWKGKLIVKGLLDPAQMPAAREAGFDGVVVSNHGGRQLDGAVATMDVLEEFVAAAQGVPVLVDSGFRTGTDMLKAMALGAAGVQIGRATLYGLSVAGEEGAYHALSLLQTELDIAMALTGIRSPGEAHPGMLRTA